MYRSFSHRHHRHSRESQYHFQLPEIIYANRQNVQVHLEQVHPIRAAQIVNQLTRQAQVAHHMAVVTNVRKLYPNEN